MKKYLLRKAIQRDCRCDGDGGCAGATGDATCYVRAQDAAVIVGIALNGIDGDVAEDVAIADCAEVTHAHDAAGEVVAGDVGVGKDDVLHLGGAEVAADDTEEALAVVGGGFSAALVEADATDDVVRTVKVAGEGGHDGYDSRVKIIPYFFQVIVANGGVVAVTVAVAVVVGGQRVGGVGDVGRLLERLAAGVVARVDVGARSMRSCASWIS